MRVPKQIVDFLNALSVDVKGYLEESLGRAFGGDLDAFYNNPGPFIDLDALIEKCRP